MGNNGALSGYGFGGFYWSSTTQIDGTSARHLDFYQGGISTHSERNRVFGFSVRCVQE